MEKLPIMHEVELHILEVRCSCGYQADTTTPKQAVSLAYVHGGACTPSIIRNLRPEYLIKS